MRLNKKVFSLLPIIILLAIGVGFVYRQSIFDWYRLWSYDPPASIKQVAKKATMTEDGKRNFYVMHPVVSSGTDFNDKCRNDMANEYSIILGCYISNDGIYLYDVDDKRLKGIVEVTAAHEMLHSAYDRLSASEKQKVDEMTSQTILNVSDNRIKKTVEQYRKQDPSSVPNELHSILGTEVAELPQELENYYKKYFADRSVVTSLSAGYETEFSTRQSKAEQIELQISGLKTEIETNQKLVNDKRFQLENDKAELDELLADGKADEYNQRVDTYNQSVSDYNQIVNDLQATINQHNALVKEYRTVSLEINDLYQSIDSRPAEL
ncbi:MAG TPA: hypothetical protein PKB09_01465 [Candidatus Saccharibacteria bacterium]|nr:hypothetical protein [Candidatus Saccharibacteria bacterium]